MITELEDDQLTLELQELYSIAKGWIADLSTVNTNLSINRERLLKTVSLQKSLGIDADVSDIRVIIGNIESQYSIIRKEIEEYLNILRPLINKSNLSYELALIEKHASLELKVNALFYTYIDIKETVSQVLPA